MVRVTTSFTNTWTDHRLRAWFPLPQPADHTVAECAFGSTTRPATAEGGPHEWAVPAYPSRRFVQAGRLTITHDGLLEHELASAARSWPSPCCGPSECCRGPLRPPGPTRRAAAPPGRHPHARTADRPLRPGPRRRRPVGPGRRGLGAAPGRPRAGPGAWRASGRRLDVRGAEVSALYRQDEWPRGAGVQPVEPSGHGGDPRPLRLPGRSSRGRGERWKDRFELRPWGVATARLDATVPGP